MRTAQVMRRRPMKSHMLEKKSATHKHALERNQSLHPAEYNNVMGQLPGKGIKKPGNQKKALVAA
jgi:ribosomal protein L35